MRVRTGETYQHTAYGTLAVITAFHGDGITTADVTVKYVSGIARGLTQRMSVAEFRDQFTGGA